MLREAPAERQERSGKAQGDPCNPREAPSESRALYTRENQTGRQDKWWIFENGRRARRFRICFKKGGSLSLEKRFCKAVLPPPQRENAHLPPRCGFPVAELPRQGHPCGPKRPGVRRPQKKARNGGTWSAANERTNNGDMPRLMQMLTDGERD